MNPLSFAGHVFTEYQVFHADLEVAFASEPLSPKGKRKLYKAKIVAVIGDHARLRIDKRLNPRQVWNWSFMMLPLPRILPALLGAEIVL